jgi:hypothetical protein
VGINWYFCVYQLILLCVSIDTTVGINWYYCVYQLILLCVSIDTTVGINWYYCVYQLILLWVSIDTIMCINWYYCVYQLILSMLSDNMYQLFFFLKTSHTQIFATSIFETVLRSHNFFLFGSGYEKKFWWGSGFYSTI